MISIIMPTLNELTFTKQAVDSLRATDNPYELIIVDDGSSDGTREWVEENRFKHIYTDSQQFTNKCWSLGIQAATQPYLAIVNNDILFTPHWDVPLVNALTDLTMIASPYFTQGEIPPDFPKGSARRVNPMHLLGCCFMVKKELFDKIGLFPSELKLWYGDNWLGEMAWRTGFKTAHVKESYIHHFVSRSANSEKVADFNKITGEDMQAYTNIQRSWT